MEAVYSRVAVKCPRILTIVILLITAQLVWTGSAHAVCEELISQMFNRKFDLREASKSCRKFINKNVRAHAIAAALVEVCNKKKNYSNRYKYRVYKVARRCVEKQSANWLVRNYNGTRVEQLRQLKAHTEITANTFCKRRNIVRYLKTAEKALSKTLSDAKNNCY
ncbi:MAG: hypothetical protein GY927_14770 [bacterium]|nr:hypothetical protein [bacterium]